MYAQADEDPERAVEAAHLADRSAGRSRAGRRPPRGRLPERAGRARDDRARRSVRRRPAAAVRLRERFVQVEVDDVEAHVARPGDARRRRWCWSRRSTGARRPRGRSLRSHRCARRTGRASRDSSASVRRCIVDHLAQVRDVDVARSSVSTFWSSCRPSSRWRGSSRAQCRRR